MNILPGFFEVIDNQGRIVVISAVRVFWISRDLLLEYSCDIVIQAPSGSSIHKFRVVEPPYDEVLVRFREALIEFHSLAGSELPSSDPGIRSIR